MPYQEDNFLEGLTCGLIATAGRPLQEPKKTFLTGISRVSAGSVLEASFDAFVSRVAIRTDSPVTIVYEYGPVDSISTTLEARKVPASSETQTFYHVCQLPQAVPMLNFRYSVHLLERDNTEVRFDARFAAFPYQGAEYPGSPEQVAGWLVRTVS